MMTKKKYNYPGARKKYRLANIKKGLCPDCSRIPESGKQKCSSCLSKVRASFKKKRLELLKIYGNKCICCGESTEQFLTFDHENNDGYKQRPRNGYSGTSIYYWLEQNNYPKDIRILCYNCNCGRTKTKNKVCPHKLLKGEE